MIRDPKLPPYGMGLYIVGFYSMEKTPNQTEGEWIYKIFRDAYNMSGVKLFIISNKTGELYTVYILYTNTRIRD